MIRPAPRVSHGRPTGAQRQPCPELSLAPLPFAVVLHAISLSYLRHFLSFSCKCDLKSVDGERMSFHRSVYELHRE